MTEYFRIRSQAGQISINRVISNSLGYKITKGKNSFVERVIKEFFKQK